MLYNPSTRIFHSGNHPLAAGAVLLDEGVAMVAASGGTVKPSAGLADEKFVGIAIFQRGPIVSLPQYVEFTATVEADTVKLPHKPLGGTLKVRVATSNLELDPANYTYDSATDNLTFKLDGLNVGVVVGFEYSPTALETRVLQGDVQPGGTVPAHHTFTGVLYKGAVFTSHFEVADDWANASLPIRLGANGKFTTQGTGAIVDAWITGVPSPSLPFLGLELR